MERALMAHRPLASSARLPSIRSAPPGYEQIDLAAGKTFAITGEQKLEFRSEFFNAFNIASYDNPDNNIADQPGFGKIIATRSNPRIIQFSLHYDF